MLDGEGFKGVERRAKRFLLPTDDEELVVMVHLMSAGRLKYVAPGGKGAKTPMFRVRFADGGELQLTEAGSKKRAGVWLLRPDALREELAHLGPEADELTTEDVARILASDSRRLHSLLRDQRLIAGIGRAWANEILWAAQLSPYSLSSQVDAAETSGSRPRSTTSSPAAWSCGSRARTTRRPTACTTSSASRARAAGTPIARVDFEEHTIYYCPALPDRGPRAEGPAHVEAAEVGTSSESDSAQPNRIRRANLVRSRIVVRHPSGGR